MILSQFIPVFLFGFFFLLLFLGGLHINFGKRGTEAMQAESIIFFFFGVVYPPWAERVAVSSLCSSRTTVEKDQQVEAFQRFLGCQWQRFVLHIFDPNCSTWEVCSARMYALMHACFLCLPGV